jgi:hypothetical protein
MYQKKNLLYFLFSTIIITIYYNNHLYLPMFYLALSVQIINIVIISFTIVQEHANSNIETKVLQKVF